MGDELWVIAGIHQLLLALLDGVCVEASCEDAPEGFASVV